MEDITSNLRTFLLEDTAKDGTDGSASTLISNAFGDRLHVNFVPDVTDYPYALIQRIAESSLHTLTERFGTEAIIQIDVYDEGMSDCITNAYLIESELAGYSGAVEDIDRALIFTSIVRDSWVPEQRKFRCTIQAEVKRTV